MFVVLNMDTATKFSKERDGLPIDEDLVSSKDFKMHIYKDLMAVAGQAKLNSLEKPKQITILLDPFTAENEFLTPTQKLKRNFAEGKLKDQIDEMYK